MLTQVKRKPHWLMLPVVMLSVLSLMTITQLNSHAMDDNCLEGRSIERGWENTNFCNATVEFSEIFNVIGKDNIPAVDDPIMESIESASEWLVDASPVIAVEINGEARAYPHALLMWHEIANDEIGGVPVAVTFCPLCNSSIVFDRRVDGDTLTFGVSGKLRNSDMIMFDRETESWWQQFIGEGIVGDFAGTLLDFVPSQVIGFGQFAERYPDGLVMSRDTGANRRYGENPYAFYDSRSGPYDRFFAQEIDDRLPALSHVLAGEVNGAPIAYPFEALSQEVVINDEVGGTPVVALWQPGVNSALDASVINSARDIGTVALFSREVDGQLLTFAPGQDGTMVDNETGSTWNLFGEAVAGELEGSELTQLIAAPHFWFAWAAFQPETEVYGL